MSSEHRQSRSQKHRKGRGFHTSRRGTGGAAYKHKNNDKHLSRLAHVGKACRIKAGCSRRYGLEKGTQYTLSHGLVGKLAEEKVQCGQNNKNSRSYGRNDQ